MKPVIHNIDLITDAPFRPVAEGVLSVFLRNRAVTRGWKKPFLDISGAHTRGRTGSAVVSVRYGDDIDGTPLDHVYRVLKIGKADALLLEKDGFERFNSRGSPYFSRLAHADDDRYSAGGAEYTVLEYDDALINSSARSLKDVSRYVMDFYYESLDAAGFDPNPIAENIGDVLYRMFLDLKEKVYGAEKLNAGDTPAGPSSMTAGARFHERISGALSPVRFESLGGRDLAGMTRDECLDALTLPGVFHLANHIHGDMNPGNVLLCIDTNGRDIHSCRLIDYGEVIPRKESGFTFVFWDPARLIGEFVLDFVEHVVASGGAPGWREACERAKGAFAAVFARDEGAGLTGIWEFLRHVLVALVESFFGITGEGHDQAFRDDEAVADFIRTLMAFLLFYTKYDREPAEKRRCALELFAELNSLRPSVGIGILAANIESLRGEIIARRDSRRRYELLKGTKFLHLDISERILSGFAAAPGTGQSLFAIRVEDARGGRERLFEIAMRMKEQAARRLLIIGAGGMGKTTALFHLFEELSGRSGPVPLYLELQWINNAAPDDLKGNWLLDHLLDTYVSRELAGDAKLTRDEKREALRSLLRRREKSPRYLLLLDGFNEVTANMDALMRSLRDFDDLLPNVMVIVASRPLGQEADDLFPGYERLELTGVSEEDIRSYLAVPEVIDGVVRGACAPVEKDLLDAWYAPEGPTLRLRRGHFDLRKEELEELLRRREAAIPYPREYQLTGLIANPFFLCLYAGTEAERRISGGGDLLQGFIDDPGTPAELMHNFFHSARIKWRRAYAGSPLAWKEEELRYYLELVLPAVGLRMAREDIFTLHEEDLRDTVMEALTRLEDDSFLDEKGYDRDPGEIRKHVSEEYGFRESRFPHYVIHEGLGKQLAVLVRSGDSGNFEFAHQNFRDYFASLTLLHQSHSLLRGRKKMAKSAGASPGDGDGRQSLFSTRAPDLHGRVQPDHLLEMLGQLCGEHRRVLRFRDGAFDDSHYYDDLEKNRSDLDRVVDLCRGVFDRDVIGQLLYNIVRCFIMSGKDLSLYDFRDLQLDRIHLAGVRLGRGDRGADFRGSTACMDTFRYDGHASPITHYAVSPYTGEFATYSENDRVLYQEWGNDFRRLVLHTAETSAVIGLLFVSPATLRVYFDNLAHGEYPALGLDILHEGVGAGYRTTLWQGKDKFNILRPDNNLNIKTTNDAQENHPVTAHALSPDGRFLVIYSRSNGVLSLYDLESGKALYSFTMTIPVVALALSETHIFIAYEDNILAIYDLQQSEIDSLKSIASIVFVAPITDLVAAACDEVLVILEENRLVLWRPFGDNNNYTLYSAAAGGFHDLSIDVSGRTVYFRQIVSDYYGILWSYDLDRMKARSLNSWRINRISALRAVNDERLLVGDTIGSIYLFDLELEKVVQTYAGHFGMVTGFSVSTDGRRFLSCGGDGHVKEWDTAHGVSLRTIRVTDGVAWSVEYLDDGSTFAVGTDEGLLLEYAEFATDSRKELACHPFGIWHCAADEKGTLYHSCLTTLYRQDGSGSAVPVLTLPDDIVTRFTVSDGIIRGFGYNLFYFEADTLTGELLRGETGSGMYHRLPRIPGTDRCLAGERYIRRPDGSVIFDITGDMYVAGANIDYPEFDISDDEKFLFKHYGALTDSPDACNGKLSPRLESVPTDPPDPWSGLSSPHPGSLPSVTFRLLERTRMRHEHARIGKKMGTELATYIESLDSPYPAMLAVLTEQFLIEQVHDIGLMQYSYMEKTDDFGAAGEQRLSISLCRSLLRIPVDRELTQKEATIFRAIVNAAGLPLQGSPPEKINRMMRNHNYTLFNTDYDRTNSDDMNQRLEISGSRARMEYKIDGATYGALFGIFRELPEYHGKPYILCEKELARTPHLIPGMAAWDQPRHAIIRKESCEIIFNNKYRAYFQTSAFERELLLSHDFSNYREGIKDVIMRAYGVKTLGELEAIRPLFVSEMIGSCANFTTGCDIVSKTAYSRNHALIHSIGANLGESYAEVLTTAKAEWAPLFKEMRGPIRYFISTAGENREKAIRMLLVSLSDYYFYDIGDEYRSLMTDVILSCVLPYVGNDLEVDFESMENNADRMFCFFRDELDFLGDKLLEIFKSAHYDLKNGSVLNCEQVENHLCQMYERNDTGKEKSRESWDWNPAYWTNMLVYLKKFSPESFDSLKACVKREEKAFIHRLYTFITGGVSEGENPLREYVLLRLREAGFHVKTDNELSVDEKIDRIFDSFQFSAEIRESVKNKLDGIKNGECIPVAIDHEGDSEPWIAVLQKLMVDSSAGDIKSGWALGEGLVCENDPEPVRRTHIRRELQQLLDKMLAGSIETISLLRVNSEYCSEQLFQEEIGGLTVNGRPLRDYIERIRFIPFFLHDLFEVFTPLQSGIFDWNTVQAIWRINQEIRPDKPDKAWLLDTKVLDYIMSYMKPMKQL